MVESIHWSPSSTFQSRPLTFPRYLARYLYLWPLFKINASKLSSQCPLIDFLRYLFMCRMRLCTYCGDVLHAFYSLLNSAWQSWQRHSAHQSTYSFLQHIFYFSNSNRSQEIWQQVIPKFILNQCQHLNINRTTPGQRFSLGNEYCLSATTSFSSQSQFKTADEICLHTSSPVTFPVPHCSLLVLKASNVLARILRSSPTDHLHSPRRTSILRSDTQAAETIYLKLLFSLHCKYLTTIAWDVLPSHCHCIIAQNLFYFFFFSQYVANSAPSKWFFASSISAVL